MPGTLEDTEAGEAAAAAMKEAQEARTALAKQAEELQQMKTAMKALQEQAKAAAPSSNIGVKTMIKVPELAPKMTFSDYKFEVDNWVSCTKGHIKEEDLAWLLLNQLPAADDKMIKRNLVERCTMDKLKSKEGVQLMLTEMKKILECEPFTRLVEWLQTWETLSQGSKSYDKYTMTLRKLAKTADDDFKIKLPQALLVAKLLLGCSAVKGTNVAMLTNGVDLNGLNDDLYSTIENKVRGFISTTDSFGNIKSGTGSHNHVLSTFTAKDWQGHPIVTPEKEPPPSMVDNLGASQEEIAEALIAFRKGNKTSAHSRLGPPKHESKEERRTRLINEGKCFEYNCSAPTTHVFENCPTRKKRLDKKKAEVIAAGGQWYDDPKEAKRARETSQTTAKSSDLKRTFKTATVKHSEINPPLNDDEVFGQVLEEDLVLQEDEDEESYLRCFKTRRILMASHYDVSEKLHHVNFSKSRHDEALLDSGCEKNCSGEVAYDSYLETLSPEDRADVKEFEGVSKFKFGGAGIYTSVKEVLIPFYVAGVRMKLRLDVVRTDIPILIGLPVLKQLNLGIQYAKKDQDYGFFNSQRFKIFLRHGHHYIKISKQGSLDSLSPEEEDDTKQHTFSTFIGKVKVFDKDKVKSQLKQIHTNYAHVTKEKMIDIIKGAGQYEAEMSPILDEIIEQCPVKKCRTRKHTQSHAKAAFRQASALGDLVTADLKIRSSGKSIMYIIDYATSFAVAALIDNKSSEECARVLVRKWYGNGLPRIKMLNTDNGKEFVGQHFKEVLQRFSTTRKFTVPYHPEMNGACERIHALIDINMAKLQEENPGLDDETCLIWSVLAYNATPTVTGYAPAQLVYGIRNVLTPGQDLSPVECQEPDSDSRYIKELMIRQEAIANHNVIRNSRKLREVILGRSKPTPARKKVGEWVWYRRQGNWLGPGQVGMSLASECSVKEGNSWYNAKHDELLPLNDHELKAHNLLPSLEESEEEDSEQEESQDLAEDGQGIIEIDYSLESLIEASKTDHSSCPRDVDSRRKESPSGDSTRSSLQCDPTPKEQGPSQDQAPEEDRSGQQALGSRASSPAEIPDLTNWTDTETESEQEEGSITTDTSGTKTRRGRLAEPVGKEASSRKRGRSIQQEDSQDNNNHHQETVGGAITLPEGFDPNLINRPAIDTAVERFKSKQEVRILNPETKEVQDVKILNGYRKPSQKSWYKVEGPQGKVIYDFNKVVWDYKYSSNLFSKRARIEPGKTYTVNHTIIHHSQHNMPGVIEAKAAEIDNHVKFGTFKLVKESSLSQSQRQKVIPSTWAVVYKGAPGRGKIKARLCARGDKEPNLEEIRTDAPTASKDSIRILLSMAASTGWKLHSLDFQAAFIQGRDIDRELYMRPPPDVRAANPGMIFRIVKRLYGLRDASRGWILEVRDFLISCGMEQSQMDRAVFFIKNEQGEIYGYIVTHIDDFLFIGNEIFHQKVIDKVLKRYVVGALEDTAMTFTGWQLEQDSKGITLSQKAYHEQIQLDSYSHMKTYTAKDSTQLGEFDQSLYRKMVGVLNWLVTSSKPALAHTCNQASTKLGKATRADAKHLVRVLEKAKLEPEIIRFSNLGNPKTWHIDIYADAALGKVNDPETYIGDIAFLRGSNGAHNVINWSASKLDIPTASILNGEAEAVTNAYGKIKYLRYIFNELLSMELPATMHTDSKSLYQTVISDNSIRNRRISAAVATIRAVKTKENITLRWVKGLDNLSDPLTKPNANASGLKHVLTTGKKLMS